MAYSARSTHRRRRKPSSKTSPEERTEPCPYEKSRLAAPKGIFFFTSIIPVDDRSAFAKGDPLADIHCIALSIRRHQRARRPQHGSSRGYSGRSDLQRFNVLRASGFSR
jgi:hypothetical protein